ncbi:cytochrome P450 [Plectosphaerella cucumerina]|uniref:Cytochrome P450 n=1 Tax=Plectosphaerella cucumerina TaxID=40658 RepID=A0A8K0TWC2_9PEZI|nr:cytochrome P450 [Plectosphaerella cucumerina]
MVTIIALIAAYNAVFFVYQLFLSPLRRVPGPFLARITQWWEYVIVFRGKSHQDYIRLHEEYGPIVRVGPNRYSFTSRQAVKKIYELGGKYIKSDYYTPLLSPDPKTQHIFPMQDNERHKDRRRKISPLYTMSTMLSYEGAVEKLNGVCIQKMHQFAKEGRLIDVPHWMQYYAFDVIGEITFNKSFGMMEKEGDTTGMISGIREANDYLAFAGLVPSVLPWLARLATLLGKTSNALMIVGYTWKQIDNHRETNTKFTKAEKGDTFLTKLLDMEASGAIANPNMLDACSSNITAGSDTTAISLSSCLYYLFTNPDKLEKLRHEIETMAADGRISDPVTFQEAQNMPYLQAVIKESLRLHPAVGTILARVVPKGGMELDGQYFPEGTEVGANAWPLHYSNDTYGPDPEAFRPERWIGEEKTSIMDSMNFSFGGGSRTCLGKNISLLEMTKVIPQIVRRFDMVLEHPDKPMETNCAWFVYTHYRARLKERESP